MVEADGPVQALCFVVCSSGALGDAAGSSPNRLMPACVSCGAESHFEDIAT